MAPTQLQDVLTRSAQRELFLNVQAASAANPSGTGAGGAVNSIGSASFPPGNEVLAVTLQNATNFNAAKSVLGM